VVERVHPVPLPVQAELGAALVGYRAIAQNLSRQGFVCAVRQLVVVAVCVSVRYGWWEFTHAWSGRRTCRFVVVRRQDSSLLRATAREPAERAKTHAMDNDRCRRRYRWRLVMLTPTKAEPSLSRAHQKFSFTMQFAASSCLRPTGENSVHPLLPLLSLSTTIYL